jgi:hypothetical protein
VVGAVEGHGRLGAVVGHDEAASHEGPGRAHPLAPEDVGHVRAGEHHEVVRPVEGDGRVAQGARERLRAGDRQPAEHGAVGRHPGGEDGPVRAGVGIGRVLRPDHEEVRAVEADGGVLDVVPGRQDPDAGVGHGPVPGDPPAEDVGAGHVLPAHEEAAGSGPHGGRDLVATGGGQRDAGSVLHHARGAHPGGEDVETGAASAVAVGDEEPGAVEGDGREGLVVGGGRDRQVGGVEDRPGGADPRAADVEAPRAVVVPGEQVVAPAEGEGGRVLAPGRHRQAHA